MARPEFLLLALLSAGAAVASPQTSLVRQPSLRQQQQAPPDSGRSCSCKGVLRRSLDCSNRERSSFSSSDLCSGRTHKADLSQNNFVAFPSAWGSHITQVNISRNRLVVMPRAPPLNVETVSLDVSENQIAQATDELRSLSALLSLNLDGNKLRTLSFLPTQCVLANLSAARNMISTLDGALSRCTELERLDLSDNQILTLPRLALTGLSKLKDLNLKKAGLVTIDGAFHDLTALEELVLSENKIITLTPGLFSNLKKLRVLYMDDNHIATLAADTFAGLVELQKLFITSNNLASISPGAFSDLNSLKYLNLYGNKLTSLPNNIFSGLAKIEIIDLLLNELQTIPPRAFAGLTSLQYVQLRFNKLASLPADAFSGVRSLEILDLAENRLTELPAGLFRDLVSLKKLFLSNNRLTTFSGRDLPGDASLKLLSVQNNLLTALPKYDASWPAVESALFGRNKIVSVDEMSVRSWLGEWGHGSQKRSVSIEDTPLIESPSDLRWALGDSSLATSTDEKNCKCGVIKKGEADVRFCVTAACPALHRSWVEVVRAAPAPVQAGRS